MFSQREVNGFLHRIVNVENSPTWTPVVALALLDDEGRVLLQQRPAGKHHAGLWEFPGGKVESGEKPRASLVREIEEELGMSLDQAQFAPVGFAEEGSDRAIVLFLYTSREKTVSPQARDGQAFGWFSLAKAGDLPLAPMDRSLLSVLAQQISV